MDHLSQLLGQRPGAAAETEQLNHEVTTDTSVWAAGLHVGESYNGAKPSAWDDTYLASMPAKAAPRVSLAVSTDLKQWNYRYMFEKKGERSLELDSRLNEMADVLQQAFGLSQEWEDPSIPNQASIFTVGRICTRLDPVPSAAKATEAAPQDVPSQKLTATNLVLETSRMVGNGQRVSLALDPKCMVRYAWSDEATQASSIVGLFPGMIVGLKGRNGSGNKFVAEELLMPPALPHPATSREEMLLHQYDEAKLHGTALRVAAVSGPYTEPKDLSFAPWHAFMSHMEAAQPDVVVVMGPFVSAKHPLVASGAIEELPTDMFKRHISQRLARLMERSPSTMVILVPSTDDIFHPHFAYPQPFIDKADPALGLPKRVRCLPNPSVFYINEIAIGVSTADVLGDLRREELVQRVQPGPSAEGKPATPSTKGTDPMMRWARHVLSQRHFYPLFPSSSASQLPLDLSHSRLCTLDQITPDIVLLPSPRTKPFLRVVDSTVVINPGTLARSGMDAPGPSFVRMQIDPLPRSTLVRAPGESQEMISHEVYQRARIDLVHTEKQ